MSDNVLLSLPLFLSLSLTACSTMEPEPTGRPLSAVEIEMLFPGHSFTLVGMKSGNELVAYADGESCTFRYVDGSRTKTVRWYTRGDRHCCIKNAKEACGRIYEVEEGVYQKFTAGRHSHTMKDFKEGNHL